MWNKGNRSSNAARWRRHDGVAEFAEVIESTLGTAQWLFLFLLLLLVATIADGNTHEARVFAIERFHEGGPERLAPSRVNHHTGPGDGLERKPMATHSCHNGN